MTKENDFNVMDSDRSQLHVIQNAINGNHLNIQGPPGTGKSQTIVNLISNLLARKKTVLVVCEKQVALQVVQDRLKIVGLDKLCLPLFHYNADKKIFAKSIIEDRDSVIRVIEKQRKSDDLNIALVNRTKQINQLRTYAMALGEVVKPLGKSLHWVHGEWSKYKDKNSDSIIAWKGIDPLEISFEEYQRLLNILDNIKSVCNIPNEERSLHWKNIRRKNFSPDYISRINRALEDIRKNVLDVTQIDCGFINVSSVANIRKAVALNELVNNYQPIPGAINANSNLKQVSIALNDALNRVKEYKILNDSFCGKYNVPFEWKHDLLNMLSDYVADDATISQLKNAALDSEKFKEYLAIIEQCLKTTHSGNWSVEEFLASKSVLLLDPIIKNLYGWDNSAKLHIILESLINLDLIYKRLNSLKKVINEFEIIHFDIDKTIASQLGSRFENSYSNFFRYLRPQYYKDCQQIRAWCNSQAPKNYKEYVEAAKSINDYFRLQRHFKILLENFNSEHVKRGMIVDSHKIPILLNSTKILVDYVNEYDHKILPEKITDLLNDIDSLQARKDLYAAVLGVQGILCSSWNIFQKKELSKEYSLSALMKSYPLLQNAIKNNLELMEAVCGVLKSNSCEYSVGHLKNNALELDKLFSKLEQIRQTQLESLLDNPDIIAEALDNPDWFKDFVDNIQQLQTLLSSDLLNLPEKLTFKMANDYVNDLQGLLPAFKKWLEDFTNSVGELNRLFECNESIEPLEEISYDSLLSMINRMLSDKDGLEKWMAYKRYSSQLERMGQAWVLNEIKNRFVDDLPALFARALWSTWLEAYYAQNEMLQNFDLKNHNQIIEEFKKLEQEILQMNSYRILEMYSPQFKDMQRFGGEDTKLLMHQSQLKSRHKPIRKVVREIGANLLEYKPCWMMSPLTLSSYIPYGALSFDVVIFDEASQMRVEHSLGAIARAKQVIIFGDENQLPPTSFFTICTENDQDDLEMIEDYESILHATKEILPGANGLLSHHYRSKYEDLIAFSNHHIYGDRLITFPNADKTEKAVLFEFVEEGVFDGGKGGSRRNEIEAQRVIEVCVKSVIENPNKSLGIISFSKTQEEAIRDALQNYLKKNPQFQSCLDETSDSSAPFFIKNLESVQGDERDIIILSVGYGRDKRAGVVYNRFGPINSQHGYRRLNVAITRAKEQIICVSSIKSSDIRNAEGSRGAYLLQKYLEYAERGIASLDASLLIQNQKEIMCDSPFEEEVERALQGRGYIVHRQVGASGFKIDLAIVDPKDDQRYILGIECDGASYHSSYSARMNDRMRQQILERLGWKLYRVWSQHWISNAEDIIDDMVRSIS
ncbi:MAG: hypothetical protein AMXMBFR12_03450 [Candidatus Babeliales bacterium]